MCDCLLETNVLFWVLFVLVFEIVLRLFLFWCMRALWVVLFVASSCFRPAADVFDCWLAVIVLIEVEKFLSEVMLLDVCGKWVL